MSSHKPRRPQVTAAVRRVVGGPRNVDAAIKRHRLGDGKRRAVALFPHVILGLAHRHRGGGIADIGKARHLSRDGASVSGIQSNAPIGVVHPGAAIRIGRGSGQKIGARRQIKGVIGGHQGDHGGGGGPRTGGGDARFRGRCRDPGGVGFRVAKDPRIRQIVVIGVKGVRLLWNSFVVRAGEEDNIGIAVCVIGTHHRIGKIGYVIEPVDVVRDHRDVGNGQKAAVLLGRMENQVSGFPQGCIGKGPSGGPIIGGQIGGVAHHPAQSFAGTDVIVRPDVSVIRC